MSIANFYDCDLELVRILLIRFPYFLMFSNLVLLNALKIEC